MGEDPSSSSPYGKIAQATKPSRSSESAVGFIDSLLARKYPIDENNPAPDLVELSPATHGRVLVEFPAIRRYGQN